MRISLGQGVAPMSPQADAQQPARWSAKERAQIYERVLGAPGGAGADVEPNREFQVLWLRFVSGVAQWGSAPAHDLAAMAGPLVDSAWAARDLWQVVDQASVLEPGGAVDLARHRTMAESGGAILEWLAAQGGGADREVHHIDLSQVVSKYIGETEKNLDAAFSRADRSGAVLLFDEADALLGKRTDVHDSHNAQRSEDIVTADEKSADQPARQPSRAGAGGPWGRP